jgi:hypothetical protein
MAMRLFTDAIDSRGFIDPRYTCDLDNSSPELRWENVPEEAQGFALVCEDPDAPGGTFGHWVVYGIPKALHHLPAGIPPQDTLPNGIRQGLNSSGRLGYLGPCPPRGSRPHLYVFRLHALSSVPELPPRLNREELLDRISAVTLATAHVEGRYARIAEKKAG